ncbi:hypothetical protein L6164_026313 [Bauhinia variegata]|nr:hypothetical protein L6164_026313 [Bauhinia variegata]
MKSTSLHRLELSGCYNLKNIPEKFESRTSIHLYGSIIVGPLGVVPRGFEYSALTIPGPSGKFALTSSVSMLPIVDKLVAGCHEWSSKVSSFAIQCCDFSDEVPVTWLSSFSNLAYLKPTYNDYHWIRRLFCAQFPCFSNLVGLDLTENFLTDEFLSTRLPWFPNLTELDLTANDFTVLPECVNQYRCLRKLVLNRCSMLREISGIPSSIKHLSAKDCFSLSSQSKSILQSHELHEGGGTFFLLPGSIPDWFHHYCRGSSLSFWFRKKFPLIALSLVLLRDWPYYGIVLVKVHVNGQEIECQTIPNFGYILRDHICLFDLKNIFESLWSQADAMQGRIKNGWNHVEIKVQPNGFRDLGWIKELGVYVYKQNPNIDDVRFTNPDREREDV